MFNFFAHSEFNLGRAGWLLLLEFLGAAALSLLLVEFGVRGEFVPIGMWLVNFLTAWHLAKAAAAQGKSVVLYGLFSALGPPAAVVSFFSLYNHDAFARLDWSMQSTSEDE